MFTDIPSASALPYWVIRCRLLTWALSVLHCALRTRWWFSSVSNNHYFEIHVKTSSCVLKVAGKAWQPTGVLVTSILNDQFYYLMKVSFRISKAARKAWQDHLRAGNINQECVYWNTSVLWRTETLSLQTEESTVLWHTSNESECVSCNTSVHSRTANLHCESFY